jgi:hypothetical protein
MEKSKPAATLRDLVRWTLASHVPPLALYGWALLTRSIPSESVWSAAGGNHGPWYTEWQGYVIGGFVLAQVLLWFGTFAVVSLHAVVARDLRSLGYGVLILGGQFLLFCFGTARYLWTVD